MTYRTSNFTRRNVRTFVVSMLTYAMLTIQLAPMAVSANSSALRRAPAASEVRRESLSQSQQRGQFAPMPAPVPQPTVPSGAPPSIVATKTDNRTPAQPAAPGDTINYTVVITNNGVTAATGVVFTDTIDSNTTLVPNSIVSTPIANADTYNVIGNVRLQPNAAQGLLANDFNPDAGNATGITASGPTTTAQNGNLTINSDGSFSYNPAPGFSGTDTFTYTLTVTATSKTDTATVTLLVGNGTATPGTNVVWFVDPAAAAGGDGRLTTPFNCYTGPAASCFSTTAVDDIGDSIFLYSGAHTGGNTLLNNQRLIGQGASDTLANIAGLTVPTGSDALPATGGASPTITTVIAATVGVPLGQGNTLRGFTISDVTGTKISGNTFGTLTVGNNTTPDVILNGSGRALGLVTGTFAATSGFVSVATTSSGAQGILLTGVAGSVSFGSTSVSGATTQGILVGTTTADINFGNTTVSGGTDGVSFQNNSAGTRTFGTLGVSGGSGNAFIHGAGGGNVTISGAATLSSAGDAISISAPGATNVINFQAGTSATRTAAGGNGVNWAGTAGATLTFSALTIQTNAGTGLNATVGGTINVTNGTGTINNTTQAAPAIVANGIALNANFSAINSSGGTNGVSLTNVTGTSNFGGGQLTGTASGATFLVSGGTATVTFGGNISQGNNAALLSISGGHSGTITFNTGLLLATGGTGAQFDNADGTYNFNGQISLNGGSASVDILNGSDGTFTFAASANISNPTGVAFTVNGGTANVTYNGAITKNNDAAGTISIINHTTGTITFQGGAIGVGSGTGLLFSNADGTYNFSVASGNTILLGGDAGIDIIGGSGGTFTFGTGVGIVNPTGIAFQETGSSPNVTFNGSINQGNAASAVVVGSKSGGTTTFNGAIVASTSTANAISLTSNVGGTINFTGGLNLTTTSGVGFNATGGGTFSATQNNTSIVNTISSTTGTALNVNTTTIGPSGLTFRSITSNGSGAPNGIILDTAGAGGLTVTGNGGTCTTAATCTGGTISNKTGADGTGNGIGVYVNNTSNVSIARMKLNDFSNYAIRGTTVTNFTLNNCFIDGVNGDNAGADEGTIIFDGLLGTSSFSSDTIKGGFEDNFRVRNSSSTANNITVDSCTIRDTSTGVSGNDNLIIEASGTANVTAHVTNNTFAATNGDHIQINTINSATMNIVITGNLYSAGGGGSALLEGITLSGGNAGSTETVRFDVSNNGTAGNPLVGNIQGGAININQGNGGGNWQGRVSNNFIGNAAVAGSGSAQSSGIRVENHSPSGSMTAIISGNTIRQWTNGPAINTQAGDAGNATNTGVINLTVTNNVAANPVAASAQHGFIANIGASGLAADASVACTDIATNTLDGNVATGGSGVRLRHRGSSTIKIPGYLGGQYDTAAVIAFETGKNPASTPAPTAATSSTGPGFGNTVGSAPCAQPTVPTVAQPIDDIASVSSNPATETANPMSQTTAASNDVTSRPFVSSPRQETVAQVVAPPVQSVVKPAVAETSTTKQEPADKGDKGIVPLVANFPLTVGTLAPGKSVTITFSVTVNNPLPGGTTQVSNQGTVSGSNFASVLTDDPDVAGSANPTVTGIVAAPDIFARDARAAEPTSGTSNMLFTVALSIPAPGPVSVNFQTADEPPGPGKAVAGTCGAGGDYVATSGTVNFTAGQQLQTVAVQVCSDATVDPDETFLLNLSGAVGGSISDGQAVGTITAANPAGDGLISEVRTSGPGGADDDFVELYNNSDSVVNVMSDDGSPGVGLFKMGAACGDTPVLIGTIPNGTVIPARGHYLFVGSAYSLGTYAAGDSTLTTNIESDRNLGFFATNDVTNLSTETRLDAVGFGTNTGGNCDLLREGTNLQPAAGSTSQYSFTRKLTSGLPQDTNDNATDFIVVATDPTAAVGSNPLPILGAPGAENLASPIQRNATIKASLLDTAAASSAPPNRVRDNTSYSDTLTPSAPNGGPPATNPYTLGTLVIRRKFTNNTGAAVTRLRFRIVDITTTNSPGAGLADVRALTSLTASVSTTCCGVVSVQGLTLEQPPTQNRGGGLNSSLAAGTVTLGTPLAAGSSINVNLLLGVATSGTFRFFVNVEALP